MLVGRLMQKRPRKRHVAAEACTTTGPPSRERFRFLLGPPLYNTPKNGVLTIIVKTHYSHCPTQTMYELSCVEGDVIHLFLYFFMCSAVLFIDTNDYKSGTHSHSYYIYLYSIRLYLITDKCCDNMFQLVNGHFRVNSRCTNPSLLNVMH
jgi:hypothetical protein